MKRSIISPPVLLLLFVLVLLGGANVRAQEDARAVPEAVVPADGQPEEEEYFEGLVTLIDASEGTFTLESFDEEEPKRTLGFKADPNDVYVCDQRRRPIDLEDVRVGHNVEVTLILAQDGRRIVDEICDRSVDADSL